MAESNAGSLRPPGFLYRGTASDRQLYCEKTRLTALAERFGTPLYVYSQATVGERFRVLNTAFRDFPHTICYSVKANSNLSLLRELARLGAGFDVVSGGELERVLRVSRRLGAKTVFSGVGKTAEEMDDALRAGILLFNVESQAELHLLAERAARLKKKAAIALRVNPDVPTETHPYISTGLREHKFGVPIQQALPIYRQAATIKHLQISGVSVHIGSQICEMEPFAASMQRVSQLVTTLQKEGFVIRYVDAGGGLGISYSGHDDFPVCAVNYAQAILTPLRKLNVHLLLEPGRAIVGPAGALVTRVLYTKQNGSKRFVVVDAAMNDLLRPSLYNAHHEIVPVTARAGSKAVFDVVGPICETGDFLARDRELEEVQPADLLAILDCGAYGISLASNYNSRPRAAEVLVNGNKVRMIRRRETIKDLLAAESL
ncbi:MAG: diaminopimelate decarboxylase [Acidobacteriales bacterium]|nr:diaminopimelate decarboxylase [Terriglobales bacterium]